MTDFLTAWDAIRVVTVSPGRVVKAELAAGSHPRLSFNPAVLRQYDEGSLAAEIEQVLTDVQADFQHRAGALAAEPHDAPTTPNPATRDRHRRYAEAIAEIHIEAASPRGHLSVTISGTDGLSVRLRPRTLSQLGWDHQALAAEAGAAIAEAHTALDKRHARIHEAVYAANRKEPTR